jgi:NADPH2:quinone reductase
MKIRAMVATAKGGPEVLKSQEIEIAWPGRADEVLVRLTASSLNPADAFFRQLGPYVAGDRPFVPGHDGAGLVEACGSAVTTVKAGDRVAFCNGGIGATPGTYASHAVVPAAQLAAIPDGLDDQAAAALPLVAITTFEALIERAHVKAGEFVLVHGGAGGTGHMAVQLAVRAGARVAATVSSAAKAEFVRGLGAELAIRYDREDFVAACRDWTGGRGLDVALDNVGPEAMKRTYKAMAPYGRIATLMGTPGDDGEESAYVGNLTLHNIMMLTPMLLGLEARLAHQAGIVAAMLKRAAAGDIAPHISARFRLEEVAAAHALLAKGGVTGKIVLINAG